MDEKFRELATRFIGPFESYGFRTVDEEYDPKSFGNAFITYANGFRLRIVRDRGDLFVEIGSLDDLSDWYHLPLVLEFLGDKVTHATCDEEALMKLRERFEVFYPAVRDLLENDFAATKPQLERFRNSKARYWQ